MSFYGRLLHEIGAGGIRTLVVLAYQSPVLRSFAFAFQAPRSCPLLLARSAVFSQMHGSLAEPSLELIWLELKLARKMFFAEPQVGERVF
jgi:hypothetical protein